MKKFNDLTIKVSYEIPSLVVMNVPQGIVAGESSGESVFYSNYHSSEEEADNGDSGVGGE